MKRNNLQKMNSYNDLQQESLDNQQLGLLNPLQINKNLQMTRQNITNFLQNLSPNQKVPIDFTRQYQQMPNYIAQQIVDCVKLMQLVDNTIRKMKNNKKMKKNWNKQDLTILLFVIQKYSMKNNKNPETFDQSDWTIIASLTPGKNNKQCMFKWLSLKKNNLNQYPWTQEEQIFLTQLVKQKGTNKWLQVSQKLYLESKGFKTYRSPKQCRQHWTCYMDPKLKKGPWTQQQDLELLKNFVKIGKKWSEISKVLNGRTQNAVKNRFNLIMQKQLKIAGKPILSNLQYAQQVILNLEISLPLVDKSRFFREQQQFYNQNQKQNPFINPFRQNQPLGNQNEIKKKSQQNAQKQLSQSQSKILQDCNSSSNCRSLKSNSNNSKVVIFKRLSLNQLMQMDGIVPATFNKQTMEIVCKDVQSVKIKQINDSQNQKQDDRSQYLNDARSEVVCNENENSIQNRQQELFMD